VAVSVNFPVEFKLPTPFVYSLLPHLQISPRLRILAAITTVEFGRPVGELVGQMAKSVQHRFPLEETISLI
jgi:hypothetical protein